METKERKGICYRKSDQPKVLTLPGRRAATSQGIHHKIYLTPETNSKFAPENGIVGRRSGFLFGVSALFSGAFAVTFRESTSVDD